MNRWHGRESLTIKLDFGSVPDWLAAIGTVGATGTALWLALQQSRPRVLTQVTAHWVTGDNRERLTAVVFNAGHINFRVQQVSMVYNGHELCQLEGSSGVLTHGESACFVASRFQVTDRLNIAESMAAIDVIARKTVEVHVHLSTGRCLRHRTPVRWWRALGARIERQRREQMLRRELSEDREVG